jgi:O-antigen/teichoic acid export membrane protein
MLPLVARVGGQDNWASINIGQSLGAFAAMCISYGWMMAGPTRVAALASDFERHRLYALSLAVRIILFLIVTPIAIAASSILSPPGHSAVAVWMAIALAMGGLSVTWYGVGTGSPRDIAVYEALPKTAAVAVSALLVFMTDVIVYYPIALCIASVIGVVAFMRTIDGWKLLFELRPRAIVRELWKGKTPALTVASAGVYSTMPVAVVSAQASAADVAFFASADKLYRITLVPISVLSNTFQGWVTGQGVGPVKRRMLIAISAHCLLGLLGLLAMATAGSIATAALFGPTVAATSTTSFWYGIAFLAVAVNTSTGLHILVPTGHTSMVFWSTVVGAGVGIPAMAYFSSAYGGEGGALGLALGEISVCLVQFACISWLRIRQWLGTGSGVLQRKTA